MSLFLEINNKFITELNVFTNMISQFRLKIVWKISSPYCMALKTHWLGSLASKVILCNTKITVGMKLLEMGKDMKIKHSISYPTK